MCPLQSCAGDFKRGFLGDHVIRSLCELGRVLEDAGLVDTAGGFGTNLGGFLHAFDDLCDSLKKILSDGDLFDAVSLCLVFKRV